MPHRPRDPHGIGIRALGIVLILFSGLALTVIVTTHGVLGTPGSQFSDYRRRGDNKVWSVRSTWARCDVDITYISVAESMRYRMTDGTVFSSDAAPLKQPPLWVRMEAPPALRVTWWGSSAFGWPFRCCVFHWYFLGNELVIDGGMPLAETSVKVPAGVVPFRLIATGAICDTLVFGIALAGIAHAVKCIRRWLRSRAGRCMVCGYDVAVLMVANGRTCPECGADVRHGPR